MARDRYGGENGMVGYTQPYGTEEELNAGEMLGASLGEGVDGASSGAQTGMAGGPIGALIGGVIGGVKGLFSGAFGHGKAWQEREKKRRAWEKAQRDLARERYQKRVQASRNVRLGYSPANMSLADSYGNSSALDLNQTPWGSGGGGGGSNVYSPAAAAKKPAGRTKETARKAGNPEPAPESKRTGMKPKVR